MDGEISVEALHDLFEDPDAAEGLVVVDIRDELSFDRGHIPGSLNVPFAELTGRLDEVAEADRIVAVCPHGKASVQAARLIASYEGIDDVPVESLAGGLDEWSSEYELDAGDSPSFGEPGESDAPF